MREQNENALAELSAYKLNVVAHGLCNHIERMLKVGFALPAVLAIGDGFVLSRSLSISISVTPSQWTLLVAHAIR